MDRDVAVGGDPSATAMFGVLDDLTTICNRLDPVAGDVADACALIAAATGAAEAYVLRAGDPAFVRVGCDCPPDQYEIKQKGYWLVWRDLAAASAAPLWSFDAADRIVVRRQPLEPHTSMTHAAAILPSDESNSELLVVRGPWSHGIDADGIRFLTVARALLSQLVGRTLDSERTARHGAQLEALANVSRALNDARAGAHVLTDLATALAKASGFDYVTIVTYNDACDEVTDRAMNRARHSDTQTASRFQGRRTATSPSELRLGVELARTGGSILLPDVFEPGLADRPDVAMMREEIAGLQRYWERAHILSMALFPIVFQERPLGFITFNAAQARKLDAGEVEFLKALLAQAATAIEGLRLYQDLQRSQEDLRQSERSLRALLNATDDTVLLINPDGTIVALNQSTEYRLTKLASSARAEGLVGRSIFDFFPPDVAEVRRARNDEVVRTGRPARFEDDRGDRWTDNSLYPVFDGAGIVVGLAVFSRDITERKVAERELKATLERLAQSREALAEKSILLEQTLAAERERARRDPLTQALNHGAISVAMRELLEHPESKQVAVLIVDVNGMKVINDTYGHLVGDGVLIAVADALQAGGALVGRYGGDEFVIVLANADRSAAEVYRDTVVEALSHRRVTDPDTGATVPVAVSIGIAIFPEEASSVSELLQQSDEEMYAAKRQRPLLPGGLSSVRLTPSDGVPAIIGDLVPLLLAPGPLNDTLRTVAHRLSLHTGHPAVSLDIFGADQRTVVAQNAFLRASDDVLDAWRQEQLTHREHPVTVLLRQTQKPFIIDDVVRDHHLTERQRELLGAAGVRSAICVPISIDHALIGVMSMGSGELAAFADHDGEFLMGVAGRLAQLIALISRLDHQGSARAA